jgi:hypothetical protein
MFAIAIDLSTYNFQRITIPADETSSSIDKNYMYGD